MPAKLTHEEALASARKRLAEKVVRNENGCLLWTGSLMSNGFPQFKYAGKNGNAHRAAWVLANGEPPANTVIRHKCVEITCIALDHLYVCSVRDKIIETHYRKPEEEKIKNSETLEELKQKLFSQVRRHPNGCLEFIGSIDLTGYGRLQYRGNYIKAHRAAMLIQHGTLPDEMLVCHHCDNRPCVDHTHLFFGTAADNKADCVAKSRQARGERGGRAKLREIDVRKILADPQRYTPEEWAEQFGVTHTSIRAILKGVNWKHVQR